MPCPRCEHHTAAPDHCPRRRTGAPVRGRDEWRRSAGIAAQTVTAVTVAALALALLARPEGLGLHATLTLATLIAAAAFGADIRLATESDVLGAAGFAEATLAAVPLTVTLIAAAVAVAAFRQVTAGHGHARTALADAARAAVLFGAALGAAALTFTTDTRDLGTGQLADYDAQSLGGVFTIAARASEAFGYGSLFLFLLLAATTVARVDWWTPPLRRFVHLAAGPLVAVAALACLLPAAGIVGYVAVLGFGEDPVAVTDLTGEQVRAGIASGIAFAPNAGVAMISLGVGAPISASLDLPAAPAEARLSRLGGPLTDTEPGLWVAPVVAAAVLGVSFLRARRRTGGAGPEVPVVGWLSVVPVAGGALAWFAGLDGRGRVHFEDEGPAGGYLATVSVGAAPGPAALLLTAAAAAVAGVVVASSRRRHGPRPLVDEQEPQEPRPVDEGSGT